jgi:hypothetical protein
LAQRGLGALDTAVTIEPMNRNRIIWTVGLILAVLHVWSTIQVGRRRGYI